MDDEIQKYLLAASGVGVITWANKRATYDFIP